MGVLEYSAEKHLQAIKEEGYDIGHEEGLDKGITGAVALLRKDGKDENTISSWISEQYNLTPDQVKKYL